MVEEHEQYFVLSWSAESSILDSGEPDEFIYEASGNIFAVDDGNGRLLVGKFRLYYVDVDRAANEGMPIFDVFDAYAHTVGYYDVLFGNNPPEFSNRILKVLKGDIFDSNVLILDRLEILPMYRSRGLGLSVMRHMIKRFAAGSSVVAIKPFPLQFESETSNVDEKKWRTKLGLLALSRNQRIATRKLIDYYNRLSFVRVSGTPIMVRASAWALPSA